MCISKKDLLSTIEAVAYVITNLKLWRIRVDIWQNQYNIVKLKQKQKQKKKLWLKLFSPITLQGFYN